MNPGFVPRRQGRVGRSLQGHGVQESGGWECRAALSLHPQPALGKDFVFGFRRHPSLCSSLKVSPSGEAELRAGQPAKTLPSNKVICPGSRDAHLISLGTFVQAVRGASCHKVEGLYFQRPLKPLGKSWHLERRHHPLDATSAGRGRSDVTAGWNLDFRGKSSS